MTTPANPRVAPTPAPTSASVAGITINVPNSSGSSSNADLYGLGPWGNLPVNAGDLPFLPNILSSAGGAGKTVTADEIVKALSGASPDQVAQIQQALLLGGYYSSGYTPTWGVVKPEDSAAFAKSVIQAGRAQQADPKNGLSVADVLLQGAQYGTAAGTAAARAQQTTIAPSVTVKQVQMPNTQDLEALALKAFQSELGRKATPAEAAAFAAAYRSMSGGVQRGANQTLYDAQVAAYQDRAQAKAAAKTPSPPNPADTTPTSDVGALRQREISDVNTPGPVSTQGLFAQGEIGNLNATTPTAGPTFSQQMMSLGQTIAQSQQDAQGTPVVLQPLQNVTQESPMSPDVAATNYARNTNPQGAAATDTSKAFDLFLNILARHFG